MEVFINKYLEQFVFILLHIYSTEKEDSTQEA